MKIIRNIRSGAFNKIWITTFLYLIVYNETIICFLRVCRIIKYNFNQCGSIWTFKKYWFIQAATRRFFLNHRYYLFNLRGVRLSGCPMLLKCNSYATVSSHTPTWLHTLYGCVCLLLFLLISIVSNEYPEPGTMCFCKHTPNANCVILFVSSMSDWFFNTLS
jgi:hypothetical protein